MRLYSAIWAIVLLCCLAGPAAAATEVKRYRAWDSLGDPTVPEFTDRRGNGNSGSFVKAAPV
jgi:hypothetical protein